MVQEHGRSTLSARAEPSLRHVWPPFGRIVSTRFDLGEAPLSDYAVCQKIGIPTLDIAQAVQRLLHLARFLHHGPDWLWSLIQTQAGKQWRECAFLDLEFMAAVLHDKLPWQRWQAFILGFPVVWKRLVTSFSAVARSPFNRCLLQLRLGPVMSVG